MSLPTDDIGWVEPAKPIRGLDHLGVQAPCIALYGQLLPGITNVTDRARYYSFHPWLIRSFEQRYRDHSINKFRRVLRRAECLFALIAIRHARVVGDGDERRRGSVGFTALARRKCVTSGTLSRIKRERATSITSSSTSWSRRGKPSAGRYSMCSASSTSKGGPSASSWSRQSATGNNRRSERASRRRSIMPWTAAGSRTCWRSVLSRTTPWTQAECTEYVRKWSGPKPAVYNLTTSSRSFGRRFNAWGVQPSSVRLVATRSPTFPHPFGIEID